MSLGAPLRETCPNGHVMAETRRRYASGDSYCLSCKIERDKWYRRKHPERYNRYNRIARLRSSYGLEPHEYDALIAHQDYRCAICRKDTWGKYGPSVDHDHLTGDVRGILCHRCNTAIGLLCEDADLIVKAAAYLKPKRKGKRK